MINYQQLEAVYNLSALPDLYNNLNIWIGQS